MGTAIGVIQTLTDKASLEEMANEVSQITEVCIFHNIQVVDFIITFSGVNDILKRIRRMDRKRRFDYIVIYSPHQICKTVAEYKEFVTILKNDFKVEVKYIRN